MKTPFFLFHSTVLTLDDDKFFSETLPETLNNPLYEVQSYTSEEDFEHQLCLLNTPELRFSQENTEELDYETHSVLISVLDVVAKLQHYFLTPRVSCCVLDCELATSSGFEVLADLSENHPVLSRVLLTGTVKESQAIEAFNAKKIDYFIPKHKSDLADSIRESVKNAVFDMFRRLSMECPFYGLVYNSPFRYLYESTSFWLRFKSFLEEVEAIEYKLISLSGVFLVENAKKESYVFANIRDDYAGLLKDYAECVEKDEFVESVIKGESFPILVQNERVTIPPPDCWSESHKIEKIIDQGHTFRMVNFKI